jgi:diaminopimelate epimerase
VLEPSRSADVFMRILNADGSEVSACGNASRCVAALLHPGLGRNRLSIETLSGTLDAEIDDDGLVTVGMGRPRFAWNDIPLARPAGDTSAIDLAFALPDGRLLAGPCVVNVGNPHCIFWVSDADSYDLASFGWELEHHSLFPERANISLAEIIDGHTIKLRVWERGTGITRACGTAACAAAVAGAQTGRTGRKVSVQLPGGVLAIEWRAGDDNVLMTGPAEFEFGGVIHMNGGGVTVEVTPQS